MLKSSNKFSIHSPFVFKLLNEAVINKTLFPEFEDIEVLRKGLLRDKTQLDLEEFGAGSHIGPISIKKVRDIAKNSSKSIKYGRLLFRVARYFHPAEILEVGTSLGFSTAYLAMGEPLSRIITLEGNFNLSLLAQKNFNELNLNRIQVISGNFDQTIPIALGKLEKLDLVFLDGNHRKDPTLKYFNQFLPKIGINTIIIVDDIHWSPEMESAWEEIKANPAVFLTVDLYFMGLVIFEPFFKEKQNFMIRF